jgi:hypothetical protein
MDLSVWYPILMLRDAAQILVGLVFLLSDYEMRETVDTANEESFHAALGRPDE